MYSVPKYLVKLENNEYSNKLYLFVKFPAMRFCFDIFESLINLSVNFNGFINTEERNKVQRTARNGDMDPIAQKHVKSEIFSHSKTIWKPHRPTS